MSEAVLCGPLLDFGTTYWGSALMREEHEGLWATGFVPTGHFGVGFFSVFMWGHRVRVSTRLYKQSQSRTRILEFRTELHAHPLLRPAKDVEQLQDGGTRVRVWLTKAPEEKGGFLYSEGEGRAVDIGLLCSWLAPTLDVDLYVDGKDGSRCVVVASDWATMDGAKLLARLSHGQIEPHMQIFSPFLQLIKDSSEHYQGRAAIFYSPQALITVGGFRASTSRLGLLGVLLGSGDRASRDAAMPLVDDDSLAEWASEQASLVAKGNFDPYHKLLCSNTVLELQGDPGDLYVAKRGQVYVSHKDLARWKSVPNEVVLCPIDMAPFTFSDVSLFSHVLGLSPDSTSRSSEQRLYDLLERSIAQAWGCSAADIQIEIRENVEVGVLLDGNPAVSPRATILSKPTS
ncbi:MAG: hypothetical protein ACJ76Y_10190 [Thermoanaerobaculia bacterium]